MAAALADWHTGLRHFNYVTPVLVFMAGAVGAVVVCCFRRRNILLVNAFNHMPCGVTVFDCNDRLLLLNRRYIELYGLSPDKVKRGCTMRNLLEQRVAAGSFGGDIDAYIRGFDVSKTGGKLVEIPDGRIFAVSNQRMPDGGLVRVHEDVTEQQRTKGALAAARGEAGRAAQDARVAHERLLAAIEVIPEGLAIFDTEDRYVLWNKRYAEIYGHYGFEFKVGMRYEDTLRTRVFLGTFPEAVGGEEPWLRERLAFRRQPVYTHERPMPGGRWLRIEDRRTPDGGSIGLRIDITELKHREASFRLLFENNPVPMWVYERETLRFLAVNPAAIKHYGYSREQFLAMTLLDILPPGDREKFGSIAGSCARDYRCGKTWRHIKADGAQIEIGCFCQRFEYEGRAATIGAIIDVTERNRAVDDLRRTRTFLDAIVENIPVSIIVKDSRDLRYVLVNRAAEAITGVPRSEMLGNSARDILRPSEAEALEADDRAALQGLKHIVHRTHSLHKRDGSECLVNTKKLGISGPSSEPEHLLTVSEDVTECQRTEERLRQAATVFASTHEGVVITDGEGTIVAVNPAFSAITGYAEAELIGQNPRVLQSGRQDDGFYGRMWRSIRAKDFWHGEIWNRRKSGEVYPELLTISAVRDDAGDVVNYVGVFADISAIKQSESRLQHLAYHDPLTDLPNRRLLLSRLDSAVAKTKSNGSHGALLLLDLDCFKNVNDSLGHLAGDGLLVLVAERLRQRVPEPDSLGRIGGDEFVVMLNEISQPEVAANFAQDLIDQFKLPFVLTGGREVYIGASIGISLFPDHGEGAHDLLQHADTALNRVKAGGRNACGFYDVALTKAVNARLQMEADLRRALDRDEFVLHYQPLVSLSDGRIVSVEALVRWRSPARDAGLVPPDEFIPLAEETGLIIPLGDWVLRAACRQMKTWVDAGLPLESVAVNLSPRQFEHPGLDERTRAILKETGLSPRHLELELTETALMGSDAADKLDALKGLGVQLTIDDFGTGYSSLAYLAHFPIEKLKIDRSFVRNIQDDRASAEIISTIITLANNLNLKVVAEGVETDVQLEFLRWHGCDTAQGYLFSRPLPNDDLVTFVGLFAASRHSWRNLARSPKALSGAV